MISFLIGRVHRLSPLTVHLNVNGVGYRVHTTLAVTEKLNARGTDEEVIFYTRVHYSETAQSIYGFLNEHEVELFDFLISLHGIGPKIVMSILSYCNIDDFLSSLKNSSPEILLRVPGIGKSKAEKILFEAKTRHKKLENIIARFGNDTGSKILSTTDLVNSILIESLETLGFQKKEIAMAEKKIQMHEPDMAPLNKDNIQLWIRTFLKYL